MCLLTLPHPSPLSWGSEHLPTAEEATEAPGGQATRRARRAQAASLLSSCSRSPSPETTGTGGASGTCTDGAPKGSSRGFQIPFTCHYVEPTCVRQTVSVPGLTLYTFSSPILTTLKGRSGWCPHYTDEKGEAQRPHGRWEGQSRTPAARIWSPCAHPPLQASLSPVIHHLLLPLPLSLSSFSLVSLPPLRPSPTLLCLFSLFPSPSLLSPSLSTTLSHSRTYIGICCSPAC